MIIKADARQIPLADKSVQMCVTSPPYWGLRDYGVEGQIGLETTPEAYVETLVKVFREVRRVLRDDGTLWLNLGDSYYGSWGNYGGQNRGNGGQRTITTGSQAPNPAYDGLEQWRPPSSYKHPSLKNKDLVGMPWRAAFALQADNWYLRSDIIWAKTNPMPESVRDRPTRSHEFLFLFAKSRRYYYDAVAIKEAAVSDHASGNGYKRDSRLTYRDDDGARGNDSQWTSLGGLRNKRDVWTISSEPTPEAHFATFPQKLIEPCILAGSREGDLVLDPFGGSGTTQIVCERLGREAILLELSEAYIEIAKARIEKFRLRREKEALKQSGVVEEHSGVQLS